MKAVVSAVGCKPLLDCAAGLIAALLEYLAIPAAVFMEHKDGVPTNALPINIAPAISGRRRHAAGPLREAAMIPPAGLRHGALGQDAVESLPAPPIMCVPERESLVTHIVKGIPAAEREEEVRRHYLFQGRAVTAPHGGAEGGEK